MQSFIDFLNDYIFGPTVPVLLLVAGLYYSFAIKFFHVRHPIRLLRASLEKDEESGTSPLSAMCLALAGTIGVGNIAGVALAISSGGAGAIFWMWVSAFLAMAVKYAEILLALSHRYPDRESEGGWRGGAMYYIKEAFGGKIGGSLAAIFALFCIFNSLTVGGAIQVSAISEVFKSSLGISPYLTGITVALLAAIIIFGNKSISSFTAIIVPIMSIIYISMSMYVIFLNRDGIGEVFSEIFTSALDFKSMSGGILGYISASGIRAGVSRGLLSNEAGCGTAPIAHASSSTKIAAKQGLLGIIEVFVDTILICTLTALVILLSGVDTQAGFGSNLTLLAFEASMGKYAGYLISLSVFMFAFATIVCQSYYGASCLRYFTSSKGVKKAYFAIFCILIFLGAIVTPKFVWDISDIVISVMTIINLICIVILSPEVKNTTKEQLPLLKITKNPR